VIECSQYKMIVNSEEVKLCCDVQSKMVLQRERNRIKRTYLRKSILIKSYRL